MGRLVAGLGTIVHACSRLDENVVHMSELRNVRLRRRTAAQPVGQDLVRHGVLTQHPSEEAFCRDPIAPLSHQHIELSTMLGTALVQMPYVPGLGRAALAQELDETY